MSGLSSRTSLLSAAGLAALAIGAGTVAGSGASTASSVVDALSGSSAVIRLGDATSGAAIVGATGMRPGSSRDGVVTIVNDGTHDIDVGFEVASVSDPGSPQLSQIVRLGAGRCTAPVTCPAGGESTIIAPVAVADGSLATPAAVGTLHPGESAKVHVTLDWPAAAGDPDLQGTSFTANLRFTAEAGA